MDILEQLNKLPLQDEDGLPLRDPAAQMLVGNRKGPNTFAHCSFLMMTNWVKRKVLDKLLLSE